MVSLFVPIVFAGLTMRRGFQTIAALNLVLRRLLHKCRATKSTNRKPRYRLKPHSNAKNFSHNYSMDERTLYNTTLDYCHKTSILATS